MHETIVGLIGTVLLVVAAGGETLGSSASPGLPNVSAAALAAQNCNDGENRRVRIINETGVTMQSFYASPPEEDSWEEDILGAGVLAPYASRVINFDDGRCRCVYDFKAVFVDGDELVRAKVNVCTTETYRYH